VLELLRSGAILVFSKDQAVERAEHPDDPFGVGSRTRGLVRRRGAGENEANGPVLINASRGPIVEEQALISVLKNKQIAGAAIDVFDIEAAGLRLTLSGRWTTYWRRRISATYRNGLYKTFYEDTVSNIRRWLDTH